MNSVILMSAILPTIGHAALIDFGLAFSGELHVIVSSKRDEPISGIERVTALRKHYQGKKVNIHHHINFSGEGAENPTTDLDWQYWKDVVFSFVAEHDRFAKIDYFIASEPYGKKMAELCDAEFIPFDTERKFVRCKSSSVRKSLLNNAKDIDQWNNILPEMKEKLVTRVTIFGQESVGKTSLKDYLADVFGFIGIHEFARPYLEFMDDKSVTYEKMATIAQGQLALQSLAGKNPQSPVIVQDTDLLSTIGYYRIYGDKRVPIECLNMFAGKKSDLYLLMPDNIPFFPDPLRYGGDKRETSYQFWKDLLDEFNCNYVEIPPIENQRAKSMFALEEINKFVKTKYQHIANFDRS